MSVLKKFETLLNGFPGILSASSFGQLEKLGNKTAEQWNRLSPYDDQLRSALPRFLQMLDHQLKSRKMANLDRIDWGEFKVYLNKNEQWLAKKDIPVYMSSLIAFSSSQLRALADAEGMTGTASSSKAPLLQPLLTPMTTASPSASNSGELKSLPLSTATRQIPKAQPLHASSAAAITRSLSAVVC